MKEINKRTYLESVGMSLIKEHFEGIEEGHSQLVESVAYMTISRLKKEFRRLKRINK